MAFKPKLAHGQPAWSTSRLSSCLPTSTHGDGAVKVVFNITARILFLRIPGLNEHHTWEPGLWVCLDQKELVMCRMSQGTWAEGNGGKEDTWISEALWKPGVNSFLSMTYWMTVLPSSRYNLVEVLNVLNFPQINSKWVSELFCFLPVSSAFVSLCHAKAEDSNWSFKHFKICHLSLCKINLVRQSLFICTQTAIPASYSSNITKEKLKGIITFHVMLALIKQPKKKLASVS